MTETVETQAKPRIEYHSVANQRITRQLVQRDIIYCCSYMISELAQNDKYMDELFPVLSQENWKDAALESSEWESKIGSGERSDIVHDEAWQDFCEEYNIEPHTIEALEHWIVTDWFADKLEARGEMIIRNFMGFDAIWGRCCSGQAILLDGVISEIAEDMEILEGQKNEWTQ